jgi:hypothetical protein
MSWSYQIPKNNLISGLSLRFYDYVYTENVWFGSTGQKLIDNGTNPIRASIPVSLLVDIDTIYLSNPMDLRQIYKPIEPVFQSSGLCNPHPPLQYNDIMDIKFDEGYFLASIHVHKDSKLKVNGGIYGMELDAINYYTNDVKKYYLGYSKYYFHTYENANSGVPANLSPFYYIYDYVPNDMSTPFITGFSGRQNTKQADSIMGIPQPNNNYMDITTAQFGDPQLELEVNYPGDDVMLCCFGYDTTKCTYAEAKPRSDMCCCKK